MADSFVRQPLTRDAYTYSVPAPTTAPATTSATRQLRDYSGYPALPQGFTYGYSPSAPYRAVMNGMPVYSNTLAPRVLDRSGGAVAPYPGTTAPVAPSRPATPAPIGTMPRPSTPGGTIPAIPRPGTGTPATPAQPYSRNFEEWRNGQMVRNFAVDDAGNRITPGGVPAPAPRATTNPYINRLTGR